MFAPLPTSKKSTSHPVPVGVVLTFLVLSHLSPGALAGSSSLFLPTGCSSPWGPADVSPDAGSLRAAPQVDGAGLGVQGPDVHSGAVEKFCSFRGPRGFFVFFRARYVFCFFSPPVLFCLSGYVYVFIYLFWEVFFFCRVVFLWARYVF